MCHCEVVTVGDLINFSPFAAWCCPVWKEHGLLCEFKSQLQTKLKNHCNSLNLIFFIQEVGMMLHISWMLEELNA